MRLTFYILAIGLTTYAILLAKKVRAQNFRESLQALESLSQNGRISRYDEQLIQCFSHTDCDRRNSFLRSIYTQIGPIFHFQCSNGNFLYDGLGFRYDLVSCSDRNNIYEIKKNLEDGLSMGLACFRENDPSGYMESLLVNHFKNQRKKIGITISCAEPMEGGEHLAAVARKPRKIEIYPGFDQTSFKESAMFHELLHLIPDFDTQNSATHNEPYKFREFRYKNGKVKKKWWKPFKRRYPNIYYDRVYACSEFCEHGASFSYREQCNLCFTGNHNDNSNQRCRALPTKKQVDKFVDSSGYGEKCFGHIKDSTIINTLYDPSVAESLSKYQIDRQLNLVNAYRNCLSEFIQEYEESYNRQLERVPQNSPERKILERRLLENQVNLKMLELSTGCVNSLFKNNHSVPDELRNDMVLLFQFLKNRTNGDTELLKKYPIEKVRRSSNYFTVCEDLIKAISTHETEH